MSRRVLERSPRRRFAGAWWRCLWAVVLWQGGAVQSGFGAETFHDPSTIVQCKGEYWLFSTGMGVKSWRSKDLTHWEAGPRIFETPPAWVNEVIPGHRGYFWAPDCILLHGRYLVYYSVSGWGKNASAIGLVSNATLDPTDPAYAWKDEGSVLQSTPRDRYNAIDASLMLDPSGRLWMAFGSFWAGVELVELDPASGKRLQPEAPLTPLAFHPQIEAPCLVARGGMFYLFIDWGWCCRGLRSTYEIRVGRSACATGPYLDRDGVDLKANGGSLLFGSEGSRIGPGHAGVLREGQNEWLSYHFYSAERGGAATLGIRRLEWGADGWPVAGEVIKE